MKRKRIEQSPSLGASIGMLLLLVWGCGQESADSLPASDDPSVPVNITTSIDANILRTRGSVYNGSIGVFLRADNGYEPQYNVKYDYDGGWKATKPVYVGIADASLFAYYPYNNAIFKDVGNPTICTFKAKNNNNTAANELFYATTGGKVNSSSPASFNMKRAYASLKLSILRDASYGGNCYISKVNLKSGNAFYETRTLDISKSENNLGGTPTDGGWTYTPAIVSSSANSMYNSVLVPPQALTDGLTITLTVDNIDQVVNIPASDFSRPHLEAGTQYTISLTMTDTELKIIGTVNIEHFGFFFKGEEIENDNVTIVYPW